MRFIVTIRRWGVDFEREREPVGVLLAYGADVRRERTIADLRERAGRMEMALEAVAEPEEGTCEARTRKLARQGLAGGGACRGVGL